MEKEVKKTLIPVEVSPVSNATAFVPSIRFIAETFNISNFVNNSIDNANFETLKNNKSPDYVTFSYDDAMTIAKYINSIKNAILSNK